MQSASSAGNPPCSPRSSIEYQELASEPAPKKNKVNAFFRDLALGIKDTFKKAGEEARQHFKRVGARSRVSAEPKFAAHQSIPSPTPSAQSQAQTKMQPPPLSLAFRGEFEDEL